MRKFLLAIVAATLPAVSAPAQQPALPKSESGSKPEKLLPVRRTPSASNSCAAFGAGFVKIAGTDTCVKVGGAVSVGAGVNTGAR